MAMLINMIHGGVAHNFVEIKNINIFFFSYLFRGSGDMHSSLEFTRANFCHGESIVAAPTLIVTIHGHSREGYFVAMRAPKFL